MTCISYMVLSGRQKVLRGKEGRALDVENVGGEGGIAPSIPLVGPLARGPAPEAVGASAGLA